MLFFKVAPGQPFSSSGQGMKSISAKASRIASSFPALLHGRRRTPNGRCALGKWSSRLPLEEYAVTSAGGRSRNPSRPVRSSTAYNTHEKNS